MDRQKLEEKIVKPLFTTIALLKDFSVVEIQRELKKREKEQLYGEFREIENNKVN